MPPESAPACETFVRLFYRWVAPEDLVGRSERDLLDAALAMWEWARVRAPETANVRAYNPAPEAPGRRSANTIVEVVTDDMPFLVDSVGMELSRQGHGIRLSIVPVIDVERDLDGRLGRVLAPGAGGAGATSEALIQFEIDRVSESGRLTALVDGVRRVLGDVRAAVEDGLEMRARMREIATALEPDPLTLDRDELAEVAAFLNWAADGHFIFLGYREYDLLAEGGNDVVRAVAGTGRGILRRAPAPGSGGSVLPADVGPLARAPQPLILTKANSRATVHRPLYLDYIGVKRLHRGVVIGERRFLGLYTAAAEQTSPAKIPILRGKVARVARRAGFPAASHQARELTKTLHELPREELLQITDDELFAIAVGIVALGERQRVRLFVRNDVYKRFVSCLVFLPRDRYNTENRERIGSVLNEAFEGSAVEWGVYLSDSTLARIHYTVRCRPHAEGPEVDALERRIATVTRPWTGHLADALREVHGEDQARELLRRYRNAFPISYRADWRARAAVVDIDRAEAIEAGEGLVVNLYQSDDGDRTSLRCKLLSPGERIALSDVLPIFENMGMRVVDERPYELTPQGRERIWLYDIGVVCEYDVDLRTGAARAAFHDAFSGVWAGTLENDRLGALVLGAGLSGHEVSLLRALVKYLRQAGTKFSDRYMQQALTGHPAVARLTVELFCARFDPAHRDQAAAERLGAEIERAVDEIAGADQSRILRECLAVVRATVRTNYFRRARDGRPQPQLSLKVDPSLIPFLPAPRPRLETFVYSPRMEGVHLRRGHVARGGIRWSDRREDFRTEMLELITMETIRNAAIVPAGAKGGFVVKRPPSEGGLDAVRKEAADCYQLFVSGLLDVTDNVVAGTVVGPPTVVRYDDDDAYLLIGLDERTAPLADLVHDVTGGAGFWLADAFAADAIGGRDADARLIGARGAWESVTRHFRGLGVAVQADELTVVAVGDMSSEPFRTGMLMSPTIRLLGAFSAEHVFIDPRPDPQISFAERRRLATTPGSSWQDYDREAISAGGGVFARSAPEVGLSPQARDALGIDAGEVVSADELIRGLLRAPVDLLWNAGAGTFIKSTSETNAEIGDRRNDAVRIDGAQVRARVLGEASRGGITQRGRIEYAGSGGRVNTDAIDGSAALACLDDDVNLRILVDAAIAEGDVPSSQRAALLAEAADAVAARALRESYAQALALSLERTQARELLDLHARLITELGRRDFVDHGLLGLTSQARIRELKTAGQGLTRPELATLLGYAKIALSSDLLGSDLPGDEYFGSDLVDELPAPAAARLRPHLRGHRLRREIISTDLANSMVDHQGTTFVFRLAEETGADTADIARAYAIAVDVFEMRAFWSEVHALDDLVDEQTQFTILLAGRRLVTRAARWLVRSRRAPLDIAAAVSDYGPAAAALWGSLPALLSGADGATWEDRVREFAGPGVPAALAARVAGMDAVFAAFDIVESVRGTDHALDRASEIHFGLERRLELAWLRNRILALPRGDIWQTLSRSTLRDQLYASHRTITAAVLDAAESPADTGAAIDTWLRAGGPAIERYLGTLRDIRAAPANEFTTLLVAIHELSKLTPRDRRR
ncbi:MAG TPA: NAD-glutamate dehydrogenase [Solirubrobacteraceae bacterium]|nr:NAD-glutamate dehydrogenase [Solirubrobacteraceae bacterium]